MSARADVSPPSRIIDFKMTGTIDDSLYIQLEWSAPGDDYDRGRGNYCFNTLLWKFDNIYSSSNDT